MKMLILAAGMGTRLGTLTEKCPKAMVELAGKPILEWTLEAAHSCGIKKIAILTGHFSQTIERYVESRNENISCIHNPEYMNSNMVVTLTKAKAFLDDTTIICYGDIVFESRILQKLTDNNSNAAVVIDKGWESYWRQRFDNPLDDAESLKLSSSGTILEIGQKVSKIEEIQGQYIGLMKFSLETLNQLFKLIESANNSEPLDTVFDGKVLSEVFMTDLLQAHIRRGGILSATTIKRGWLEIDDQRDLAIAEEEIAKGSVILGGKQN